jgi:hypothetical protein
MQVSWNAPQPSLPSYMWLLSLIIFLISRCEWAGDVTKFVEYLPSKHKDMSSNPSTNKNKIQVPSIMLTFLIWTFMYDNKCE